MNATFPNYTPFLVVFSILIGLCLVFQIVCPNVIFSKAKQKKKEFEIAFQQIRDNSIKAEEYASKKNAYIALLSSYSKAKLACDVMGSLFITVGVLVLFAGLSIFLWMIETNAFLSVLAKIGSVLSAIVGVVIEIPLSIASFSKIRE